ncbi:hypothetical protein ACOME3_010123 [Neoechinorhynchus agilis]
MTTKAAASILLSDQMSEIAGFDPRHHQMDSGTDNLVQAIIRCNINLLKFTNIDLFAQGLYQVRVYNQCTGRVPDYSIRVSLAESMDLAGDCAAIADNGIAYSSPCRVIYKNEVMTLRDSFSFEISVQVDCCRLLRSFKDIKLNLCVELYFVKFKHLACDDQGVILKDSLLMDHTKEMRLVCSRRFKIIFDPRSGVHTYLNVLFDYLHLCSVQMTVHYGLVAIVPLCLHKVGRDHPNVGIFSAIFKSNETDATHRSSDDSELCVAVTRSSDRFRRALGVFRNICKLLITAREQMIQTLNNLSRGAESIQSRNSSPQTNLSEGIHFDETNSLNELLLTFINSGGSEVYLDVYSIDSVAHQRITHCSAQNILVWTTLIERIDHSIVTFMKRERHMKRVKRLSEGFFYREVPKGSALSSSLPEQLDIYNELRQSSYFERAFPLVAECDELDGSSSSLPVVFEECYIWTTPQSEHLEPISLSTVSSASADSPIVRKVINNRGVCSSHSISISNLPSLRDHRKSKCEDWIYKDDDARVKLVSYRSLDGRINVSCNEMRSRKSTNSSSVPQDVERFTLESKQHINGATLESGDSFDRAMYEQSSDKEEAAIKDEKAPQILQSTNPGFTQYTAVCVPSQKAECKDFYADQLINFIRKKEAFKVFLANHKHQQIL